MSPATYNKRKSDKNYEFLTRLYEKDVHDVSLAKLKIMHVRWNSGKQYFYSIINIHYFKVIIQKRTQYL
jgi:hypothetical protein